MTFIKDSDFISVLGLWQVYPWAWYLGSVLGKNSVVYYVLCYVTLCYVILCHCMCVVHVLVNTCSVRINTPPCCTLSVSIHFGVSEVMTVGSSTLCSDIMPFSNSTKCTLVYPCPLFHIMLSKNHYNVTMIPYSGLFSWGEKMDESCVRG